MPEKQRDRDDIAIGQRIRKLRDAHGLKQQALAVMLGNTSHSVISEIERGRRRASMPILKALSRHFHVSVAFLLGEDPQAEQAITEALMLKAAYRAALERLQSCNDNMTDAMHDAFALLDQGS